MSDRRFAMPVLLLLVAASCGGPRRSEDPKVVDQEITRDLMSELLADERYADIRVTCEKGVVTLDGVVTEESDRDRAGRIAWSVSGVRDVRSRLRLRSR
jgi:osmotically-inducible protein OsmY